MNKKFFLNIIIIVFPILFGTCLGLFIIPQSITSSNIDNYNENEILKTKIDQIYNINFDFETKTEDKINLYLVDRNLTSLDESILL